MTPYPTRISLPSYFDAVLLCANPFIMLSLNSLLLDPGPSGDRQLAGCSCIGTRSKPARYLCTLHSALTLALLFCSSAACLPRADSCPRHEASTIAQRLRASLQPGGPSGFHALLCGCARAPVA